MTRTAILVLNAGSTSLKFALFEPKPREELVSGSLDWADGNREQARFRLQKRGESEVRAMAPVTDHRAAARYAIEQLSRAHVLAAVGHRVVHGGAAFAESCRIDTRVKETIAGFSALAPLHNPPALAAIEAAEAALPEVPQIAVFDTAFFARLPERAYLFPLPYEWHERFGIRRIGFHGISHAACAANAAAILGRPLEDLRLITCHLGGGCSATAVSHGAPVATTMGFTPLDGLMMGTRCGAIDPGILVHLQRECGLSVEEIDQALNHRSGLLGVSGVSPGSLEIETAMQAGHARARLAFEMFADRVRSAVGALAVTLGGVDALVFTANIGERSPLLRAEVCRGLACLGLQLDSARNASARANADIAAPDSTGRILVIRAREELAIAREVGSWLGRRRGA